VQQRALGVLFLGIAVCSCSPRIRIRRLRGGAVGCRRVASAAGTLARPVGLSRTPRGKERARRILTREPG